MSANRLDGRASGIPTAPQSGGSPGGVGATRPAGSSTQASAPEGLARRHGVPTASLSPRGDAPQRGKDPTDPLTQEVNRLKTRQQDLQQRLDGLQPKLNEVNTRLAQAQQRAQAVPTHGPLGSLMRLEHTTDNEIQRLQNELIPLTGQHNRILEAMQNTKDDLKVAERRLEAAKNPPPNRHPAAATPPALQSLSAAEQSSLQAALPNGGAAVNRLAGRARLQQPANWKDRLRTKVQRAPRPLEGTLLTHFEDLVRRDVQHLAQQTGQSAAHAATLMLRAVATGTLASALPAQAKAQLTQALKEVRETASPLPLHKPVAINQQPSGPTIDLTSNPQTTLATLSPEQQKELLQALNLGVPSDDIQTLYRQNFWAADLLNEHFAQHVVQPEAQAALEKHLGPFKL